MMNNMDFRNIALSHAEKYPLMQAQDYVKLAYQSAFGAGHMVSGFENALARVKSERMHETENVSSEDIGGGYVRLHLSGGEYPLSCETAARMFVLSAESVPESKDTFFAFSEILLTLSAEGAIRPAQSEIGASLQKFRSGDFSPVSHTDIYRESYRPAYRVIKKEFSNYLPLISRLDVLKQKKSRAIIAIDGMCAGGKTTLSSLLGAVFASPVYHMDDFFLPPAKRTDKRLNEPGGNVDYERFRSDVLDPLLSGKPFSFRPFDCSVMDFVAPVHCSPAPLSIVEGSYACHPTLIHDYDFRIFVSVDPALQIERIRLRNGEDMLKRFIGEWIPMEMRYFDVFSIPEKADVIIKNGR